VTSTDLVVVRPGIMGSTLGRTDRGRPASEDLMWAAVGGCRDWCGTELHGAHAPPPTA
jgi:hypothetical protein